MRQMLLFAVLLFAIGVASAFGQGGFAAKAVGVGKTDEAIRACGQVPYDMPTNFYIPLQTSYTKGGETYVAQKDQWTCMWTGARYQWKAEPAGSVYHVLDNGEYSFEGNSSHGIRACHNRVLAIYYAEEVIVTQTYVPPTKPKCANLDITIEDARKIPGMTVTDEGQCVMPQAPPQPTPVPVQCPECWKIGYQANKEGVLNKKQAGLSAAVGGGVSGIGSNGGAKRRLAYAGLGALISFGANVGVRAADKNARSDKSFTFVASKSGHQTQTFTLKKGQSHNEDGLKIDWKGDHWELDDETCYGVFQPRDNFIFTPVPIISRKSTTTQQQAVKNQTLPPKRTGIAQTGQGNRIPGGGVQPTYAPGTTVDHRPTLTQTTTSNGQAAIMRRP